MSEDFHYGGQAVIEGVMMRGRKSAVTVVRRSDGELVTAVRPLSHFQQGRIRKIPFLRGILVLIEALVLGIRSLFYSANVSLEDTEEQISGGLVWVMLLVSLALAAALFVVTPLFITRLLEPESKSTESTSVGVVLVFSNVTVMFEAGVKFRTCVPGLNVPEYIS